MPNSLLGVFGFLLFVPALFALEIGHYFFLTSLLAVSCSVSGCCTQYYKVYVAMMRSPFARNLPKKNVLVSLRLTEFATSRQCRC